MTTGKNRNAYMYNANVIDESSKSQDEESLSPHINQDSHNHYSGKVVFMSSPSTSSNVLQSFNNSFGNKTESPNTPHEDTFDSHPSSPELSPVHTPAHGKRRKRVMPADSSPPSNATPSKRNRNCSAKCSNCAAEQTPLWRKGADGKTLCNKCGLYWSRHNKHRPVRLERTQTPGAPATCTTPVRKTSLPTMNTKLSNSTPTLKAKKLESPLKRSFSYEEQIYDSHQSKRKKLDFKDSGPKRKKRQSSPDLHEEHSHSSLDEDENSLDDDAESVNSQFGSGLTPQSASITAIQHQLAAFGMRAQAVGHSSENEFKVAQEQPSLEPTQEPFSGNVSNVPSDPFLAQLLTTNTGDATFYNPYLQTQLLDSGSAMQFQQQPQQPSLQSSLHLQVQPQTFYDQHHLQLAFNDGNNMHSPCGDNLDSLFSSLFGNSGIAVSTCGPNSVNNCNGTTYTYNDYVSDNNGAFLGSPFL